LILLANLGVHRHWARLATFVCLVALLAGVAVLGVFDYLAAFVPAPGAPGPGEAATLGGGLLVSAALAGVALLPVMRPWLARLPGLDPANPVHAVAIAFAVLVFGFNVSLQLSTDVLAQTASSSSALMPLDLIGQEIPFLLAAVMGVGLFVRRPPLTALQRLGLVAPAWWQVALALAAAGVFYAFSTGVDLVSQTFTPDLAHKVDSANQRLFGKLDTPLGIVTLAVAAGVCEEALFRGALQPRFGILLTSVLFASVHTQYGLTFDVIGVFVLSCGLGLIRRVANTSTAMACHVAYDLLVGVGVSLALLPWALIAEAALVAMLVATYLRAPQRLGARA